MSQNQSAAAQSIAECADACGIGRSKLYMLIKEKRGPRTIRIGKRHLVRIVDRDEWLASLAAVAA